MALNETIATTRKRIRSHRDVEVFQQAMKVAMQIFELTREFPQEEMYSLTSQLRRSSRSVAINFIESWRERRYEAAFVSKLSDCETEAAETQGHIEFAVRCSYLKPDVGRELYRKYDRIIQTLVAMIEHADRWLIIPNSRKSQSHK